MKKEAVAKEVVEQELEEGKPTRKLASKSGKGGVKRPKNLAELKAMAKAAKAKC